MEAHHINNDRENKTESKSPIPAPSHPKQYRAIGLILGKYQNSSEKLTKGFITTKEGQIIEAVLLGRIIALIKNHIDLKKEHVWVVYPHAQPDSNNFHVQIVGVWQPETLNQKSQVSLNTNGELPFKHGYFSIRGEVIFYSKEERKVIIRIIQSPSKKSSKPNFLKLQLTGTLPNNCLGHFFSLDVFLKADDLIIEKANDLGLLPKKNMSNKRKFCSNYRQKKNAFTSPKIKNI
jgi:hypothetical protein